MLKKYRTVTLLLSILLLIGIVGCGNSKTSKGKGKTSQVAQSGSNDLANASTSSALTTASLVEQEDIPIELRILSSEEFGRDNPFVPLTASARMNSVKVNINVADSYLDPSERKFLPPPAPVVKTPELPNVRLSLIIDGSTAIFEENSSSKVLTVGETVGGMKIQEIRREGAVLIKGDKKYTAVPNGKLEEIPSPVQPQEKKTGDAVKPTKTKKK